MARLFTYTIPVDDGAAPNPFRGMCSLVICKPGIRRVAKPDDWVAGLGSMNAPSGDLSGHLVYAMRVEEVLTLREYDEQALSRWPHRVPVARSLIFRSDWGTASTIFQAVQPFNSKVSTVLATKRRICAAKTPSSRKIFTTLAVGPEGCLITCFHYAIRRRDTGAMRTRPTLTSLSRGCAALVLRGQLYGWPDFVVDWSEIGRHGGFAIRELDDESDIPC